MRRHTPVTLESRQVTCYTRQLRHTSSMLQANSQRFQVPSLTDDQTHISTSRAILHSD